MEVRITTQFCSLKRRPVTVWMLLLLAYNLLLVVEIIKM